MREKDYIVIIGSANIDVAGYSHQPLNYADSNPGKIKFTPGGVGRNIAHNLALLGKNAWLLSAVGGDFYGQSLLAQTNQSGVYVDKCLIVPDENTSSYLSLMAIPGGILFARILSPAMEPSQVTFENLSFSETPPKSIIEAAANGAMTGLKIAAGVATVVMAFVAIIALINGIIGGIGGWFGFANVSLESIFGYVLAPLAWIMGVDWNDANLAGSLIGQKLAINEFVAYLNFSPYLQTGGTLDVKTIAIISFALCGFANFGSIGVVVGAFSAISPKRAPEIAQLGLRALAAATLS
ncbi:PfkB family carbohydrate kinase, partial [Escherichia albertii]|nr:PfkB family carbohydrate kinase [Escherichia albertii]